MGNHQGRPFVGPHSIFQHLFSRNVEVIGGLVQDQQVAWSHEHQGKGKACFLPTTELANVLEHRVIAEPKPA